MFYAGTWRFYVFVYVFHRWVSVRVGVARSMGAVEVCETREHFDGSVLL